MIKKTTQGRYNPNKIISIYQSFQQKNTNMKSGGSSNTISDFTIQSIRTIHQITVEICLNTNLFLWNFMILF